jgi:predicted RNA-binding Zn-ribbon protein involved in translation (DUF1610 family)
MSEEFITYPCPNCHSIVVVKCGKTLRSGSKILQVYQCKKCGRKYTIKGCEETNVEGMHS